MSDSWDTYERDAARYAPGSANGYQTATPTYQVPRFRRKWKLPLTMFVLTILSTFWVGVTAGVPEAVLYNIFSQHSLVQLRQCILSNWETGLLFSGGVIGILLAHEMGHYVMTRIYHVFSSYPIFVPFPLNPLGTMGAIIIMDGRSADRKEIFDIGIAGPLAGLVVAIPVAILGLMSHSTPNYVFDNATHFGVPLAFKLLDWGMGTGAFTSTKGIALESVSPLLMAAWIGLFVTGLNMMPMSQLDGGHVAFGLLGKMSVYVAYATFVLCLGYMIYSKQTVFMLMLGLILLMKLRHPPSRNDNVRIGWWRSVLAVASLALPVLCIPAEIIIEY